MLQFAALSPAHNFLSLAPKFTLPFSSSAPSPHACARKKGPTSTMKPVHVGASHGTSGTDTTPNPFQSPSQTETGFPELFHRRCSLSRQSQARLTSSPPPQDGTLVNPSPSSRSSPSPSPPVLPHLDNKNPGTPVQPFLLLLSYFSPPRLRLRRPTWPLCLSPGPVRSSPLSRMTRDD